MNVLDLDCRTLAKSHPELAKAIGSGRVISHNVLYVGFGIIFTFVVEDG